MQGRIGEKGGNSGKGMNRGCARVVESCLKDMSALASRPANSLYRTWCSCRFHQNPASRKCTFLSELQNFRPKDGTFSGVW